MLKLPSNLMSINVLDSFVQDVVHQYKISQEVHGNMLISLTEAVTNAITHGNHYDENKVVQINLKKNRTLLQSVFQIRAAALTRKVSQIQLVMKTSVNVAEEAYS